MPVGGVHRARGAEDEDQNRHDLDQHHRVVGFGALSDTSHQNIGEDHQDQKRRQVKPISGELPLHDHGIGELFGKVEAEEVIENVVEVGRETHRDAHVGDCVLENQVPSDDPSENFAQGRVRIGVSAAGDRDHGREFCVAQRRETTGDGDQDK